MGNKNFQVIFLVIDWMIHLPVCPLFSRSFGWSGEAHQSLPGVGAGDALWLQLRAHVASAATCWQTHHSGAGPAYSRPRGGNHTSGWFQTQAGELMACFP